MSKYFKTVFTVTVLSTEQRGDTGVDELIKELAESPDSLGDITDATVEELSSDEMQDALIEIGDDGSFFGALDMDDEDESEIPSNPDKGPGNQDENLDDDLKWDNSDDEELLVDDADSDEEITED